jgi:hypothetical protein
MTPIYHLVAIGALFACRSAARRGERDRMYALADRVPEEFADERALALAQYVSVRPPRTRLEMQHMLRELERCCASLERSDVVGSGIAIEEMGRQANVLRLELAAGGGA